MPLIADDKSKASADGALTAHALASLFEPRHIAVIGASRTPGKHGNTVVRNLLAWGYRGRVFPINPAGEPVEGLPCYRAVSEAPTAPDCAFLVIPASAAVDSVQQCADAGVRNIVIAATGFAETGTEKGVLRQAEIARIARIAGMRVLGPNTNGFLNAAIGASLGYNTSHAEVAAAGTISIASHSGALFNAIARRLSAAGTDLNKFVSIGNEADVNILDVLDYLIEDAATQVIGLLIEGLTDGARFRMLAERARSRGKPMVALKLGRSAAGASSSLAHSSRLAGEARAYDALFRACGVASVTSLEALTGGCSLLARFNPLDANGDQGLICVATSGAGGTLAVDFAGARNIPLAGRTDGSWPETITAALGAVPEIGPLRNPIDTSGLRGDRSRLLPVLQTLKAHGHGGPVAVFSHVGARQNQDAKMARALIARQAENPTAPTVIMAPGRLLPEIEQTYGEAGIPLFHDMISAFDSLACYYAALPHGRDAAVPGATALPEANVRAIDTLLRDAKGKVLSEWQSSEILQHASIPVVERRRVDSAAATTAAANALGYPVALKAQPAGVAHKDKLGLVRLGLANPADLAAAFTALQATLASEGFSSGAASFIVQPMIASRIELLAGVSTDAALGRFLVFGLGGVQTEALDQVQLLPIPSSAEEIRDTVGTSVIGRILATRHDGLTLLDQFAAILGRLQDLAAACGDAIESVDLNPLLIGPDGWVAVDALIVRS